LPELGRRILLSEGSSAQLVRWLVVPKNGDVRRGMHVKSMERLALSRACYNDWLLLSLLLVLLLLLLVWLAWF